MSNIQIMNEADKIMAEWDGSGFFMDFYSLKTGRHIDDDGYSLVYEMLIDGLLR